MAEDEAIFDPSLKKKKKKKKTPFDMEAAMSGETAEPAPEEETKEEEETEEKEAVDDEDLNLDDFTNMKKKKKKKKKPLDMDELSEALPENEDKDEDGSKQESSNLADNDDFGDDFDLLSTKKKKKKKVKINMDDLGSEDTVDAGEDSAKTVSSSSSQTWLDSERDYTYDELLTRVFDIMREKNPDMVAGEKKKIVMKPPQVMRVGTKKSSFSNFADICKMLHRQPKHLLAFLLAELGTSGSLDGTNQLIIKGRFQQKQIENVLRRYIKEYVTCHTCRSPDTLLQKEERLFFLQCETCGSRCSVASIKSGFQAVTGKRAAIRAKTA
ncbi:eukaryotic translation initiation factor 2 subunit 2 [Lingula anatina]|uniref:Eukaryotic translation initiation factor 2 subunit 2 n=1 Tax=Lingula anatina TaxID=7574 RepID=A0A1S3HCL2_LINAN|nr:eukaryotic translation initiation factor 2 subunit 2-like [Lingula anatina]XP_013395873.1 eukaryotic translation initiation factor 2 subunit 2 [Lingula anatina]|eukprot:XP_013383753.1 eukaryotic translation initiation factor 2 subunit 2-like [Lingula anatina]